MEGGTKPTGNPLQLLLAAGSFFFSFSIFGTLTATMPILAPALHVDKTQAGVALTTLIILGSIGRLVVGVLTDKYGPRKLLTFVLLAAIAAVLLMTRARNYEHLLGCATAMGIALASFSVGVKMCSGWYPPERRGMALGVLGLGMGGQSLSSFLAPIIAAHWGYKWAFWSFGLIGALWLLVVWVFAEDPPGVVPEGVAALLSPLTRARVWVLGLVYLQTFGGFLAIGIYFPTYMTMRFDMTPQAAGTLTAGFVLASTLVRPLGGILSDKVGGSRVAHASLVVAAVAFAFMRAPTLGGFIGATAVLSVAFGFGNGALFKIAASDFPQSMGSVGGLLGAIGALGAFVPPAILTASQKLGGNVSYGFLLLAATALLSTTVLAASDRGRTRVVSLLPSGVGKRPSRPPLAEA